MKAGMAGQGQTLGSQAVSWLPRTLKVVRLDSCASDPGTVPMNEQ